MIKGNVKEVKTYKKSVGLFEGIPVLVSPSKEDASKLGLELKEDKNYVSVDQNGNNRINITFWLKEKFTGDFKPVTFFLSEEKDVAKSGKIKFINSAGLTSYADTVNDLPTWFTANRTVREAYRGESELYGFITKYLSAIDTHDPANEIILDRTEDLLKGDFSELREMLKNFSKESVVALATIKSTPDGNEFQNVYNKEFLPGYALVYFDGRKNPTKSIQKFIDNVNGDYGCKDYYILEPMKDYDPNAIVVSNNATIVNSDVNIDDLPF